MDVERPVHDSLCKSATPDAPSVFATSSSPLPSSRAKRRDPVPMSPRQPGAAPGPAAVSGSLRCARD